MKLASIGLFPGTSKMASGPCHHVTLTLPVIEPSTKDFHSLLMHHKNDVTAGCMINPCSAQHL